MTTKTEGIIWLRKDWVRSRIQGNNFLILIHHPPFELPLSLNISIWKVTESVKLRRVFATRNGDRNTYIDSISDIFLIALFGKFFVPWEKCCSYTWTCTRVTCQFRHVYTIRGTEGLLQLRNGKLTVDHLCHYLGKESRYKADLQFQVVFM